VFATSLFIDPALQKCLADTNIFRRLMALTVSTSG
jgi:hypothetical protein